MDAVERDGSRVAERAHLAQLAAASARGGVSRRKAQGSHYTPPALVAHLVSEALLKGVALRPTYADRRLPRIIDPACGTGNFLVAVARTLGGAEPRVIADLLEHAIHGIDIDAAAIGLARKALLELLPDGTPAPRRRRVASALRKHLVVGDALLERTWRSFGGEPFDLVLGNPPFLGQLKRGTAASRTRARVVSRATGGVVRRYADTSAAFLLRGVAALGPNGRLAFVMPLSFLSAADARAARDAILEQAALRAIYAAEEGLFADANVRVCALVLEHGANSACEPVRRAFGADFTRLPAAKAHPRPGDPSWSPLLADAFGAPGSASPKAGEPTIALHARATADFRDQYYGLRGALREDPRAEAPLVTTKHIDLASNAWGACDVRVLGEKMRHPAVDVRALAGAPKMLAWLEARRVPKILVATQTKVIEAWVDARGDAVPLVPIITVTPLRAGELWKVAAAVASPVVAARAIALYAGSALSASAIKLSARQILAMPVPTDARLWRESARLLRTACEARTPAERAEGLRAFANASCRAHGLRGAELLEMQRFWESRAGLSEPAPSARRGPDAASVRRRGQKQHRPRRAGDA